MVGTTIQTNSMIVVESDLQKKIIALLSSKGPMTRDQLCKELGYEKHQVEYSAIPFRQGNDEHSPVHVVQEQYYCRTTVYDQLVKLINRHVVDKYPVQNGKQGRPQVLFVLEPGITAG